MLTIYPENNRTEAIDFCKLFLREKTRPRYIMGINQYANSIAQCIDVNGFIDDFTNETKYLGKPILKTEEIRKDSLVVSVVVLGRPVTALARLQNHGITSCLDYFNFFKYSGLELKEIEIMRLSRIDVKENRHKYQWLYDRWSDEQSKNIFNKLINFRISGDLNYMREFAYDPYRQYFEDFLELKRGEIFVDAGGFDGQTTIAFIKRCPAYQAIHFFEPDRKNIAHAKNNLSANNHIFFYTAGLAKGKGNLRFNSQGSGSKLCETGDLDVQVDTLDTLIKGKITFIKMDIEGAEGIALQGARGHILKNHPKLAICCYHKFDDFWRIPEQILAMREDYALYLRHYTEGLEETVLFFIPNA